MDMSSFSSKEDDSITKARKPYTITKQRERWSLEEHNRFLEAIKLYGRAWQKIEEHIGTKTAVQIRSHAQKFFSKLEKEALIKGMPLGQAREIDIPPPRPKRKPNNPYPRKTSSGTRTAVSAGLKDGYFSTSSSYSSKQIQNLENDLHLEKPCKKTRGKEVLDMDNNSSGITTLSQETSCTSLSPSIKVSPATVEPKNQSVLRDHIPLVKEVSNEGGEDKYCLETDPEGNRTDCNYTDVDDGMSGAGNSNNSSHNLDEEVIKGDKLKHQNDILCLVPKEERQSNQNYPRHIPIHVLESSSEACISIIPQVEGSLKTENNPTTCANTESHSNIFSNCPATVTNNEEHYNMFVNTSFSNLIVSALLQNPAAHAVASFAASLWPFTNAKTADTSPSTSAIAAATVMAASAWWAAHGLLPLCPPLHAGFTCVPAPPVPSPMDPSPISVEKVEVDPVLSGNKSSVVSLSDHNEKKNDSAGSDNAAEPNNSHNLEQKPAKTGKTKEQVDRSSCGSNTPSGSEAEMEDMRPAANGKDDEPPGDANHWTGEPNSYRTSRSTGGGNLNESWREVSQEGKLAFKALFSRQVLPQSFSPEQLMKSSGQGGIQLGSKADENSEDKKLQIDLNSKTPLTCVNDDDCEENIEKVELGRRENIEKEEEFLLIGGCPKPQRAGGFKPYKRCSMESSTSNISNQAEERDPKRLCIQGKGSTTA